MNPPGHAKLAFDFLAVDDQKSPYKGASLLRHILSIIPVENTLAWDQPVFSVMDGIVIAASDGVSDRARISMARDLFRLMLFGPKMAPPFSALGGELRHSEMRRRIPALCTFEKGVRLRSSWRHCAQW
jgi:hypothetical protein